MTIGENILKESKLPYITVIKIGTGYAAAYIFWDKESGFFDIWQTGVGRYGEREPAECEARDWAYAEEMEFRK